MFGLCDDCLCFEKWHTQKNHQPALCTLVCIYSIVRCFSSASVYHTSISSASISDSMLQAVSFISLSLPSCGVGSCDVIRFDPIRSCRMSFVSKSHSHCVQIEFVCAWDTVWNRFMQPLRVFFLREAAKQLCAEAIEFFSFFRESFCSCNSFVWYLCCGSVPVLYLNTLWSVFCGWTHIWRCLLFCWKTRLFFK